MNTTKILAMAAVAGTTALTAAEKPTVEIVSSKMRASDPTVMEVGYCVHAATNRVDVRARSKTIVATTKRQDNDKRKKKTEKRSAR